MIERYGNWIVRFRWLVLLVSVVSVLGLMSGGRFLAFTNDYRVFFSKDNPQLLAFEELQETYTKSDNILIMLEPKGGDVFTPEVLAAVIDLTERAWQVPYSVRVDSLSNFQHMTAEGDDLLVNDLVEQVDNLSQADIDAMRTAALDQPLLVKKLLSPSTDVTGVNITVEMPQELSDADRLLPPEERAAKDPAIALQQAVDYTRGAG